jgi:DUF1680 family protein
LPSGKVTLKQTTRYPWQGDVQFEISPDKPGEFDFYLRIPGWCQHARSADDLYDVIDRPATGAVRLTINGRPIESPDMVRGYARIHRRWQAGDTVQLSLDIPIRRVRASPKVEADIDRVTLMRGPIIYCVEGADNPQGVRDLIVGPDVKFIAEYRQDLLGGVTVLRGSAAAYVDNDGKHEQKPVDVLAIPYYANCNRRPCEMLVWLAENADRAQPRPAPATK